MRSSDEMDRAARREGDADSPLAECSECSEVAGPSGSAESARVAARADAGDFESFGINAGFVEEIHDQFAVDPTSVDESWSQHFGANGSAEPATRKQVDPARIADQTVDLPKARPAKPASVASAWHRWSHQS